MLKLSDAGVENGWREREEKLCIVSLCAVHFESASWKLLIVNVYMPCEGSSSEEFCEQLACIEGIISQYPDCHIVLCGDFNIDFCRVWPHTDMLNEFCIKLDLCASARHTKMKLITRITLQ